MIQCSLALLTTSKISYKNAGLILIQCTKFVSLVSRPLNAQGEQSYATMSYLLFFTQCLLTLKSRVNYCIINYTSNDCTPDHRASDSKRNILYLMQVIKVVIMNPTDWCNVGDENNVIMNPTDWCKWSWTQQVYEYKYWFYWLSPGKSSLLASLFSANSFGVSIVCTFLWRGDVLKGTWLPFLLARTLSLVIQEHNYQLELSQPQHIAWH